MCELAQLADQLSVRQACRLLTLGSCPYFFEKIIPCGIGFTRQQEVARESGVL